MYNCRHFGGIVLILSWWILFNKFYLIVGAIAILYNVFLIVRFINSQKKLYNKVLKEELNKFIHLENDEEFYKLKQLINNGIDLWLDDGRLKTLLITPEITRE